MEGGYFQAEVSVALQHVIVGVIYNPQGQVLLTLRPRHVHQGGLWEFPGGKLEPGEGAPVGLRRELQEELGIEVLTARPLIQVPYHYPDKSVLLDVWEVQAFQDQPHGREGQPWAWVNPEDLPRYPMPAANRPIMTAVRLPPVYLVTPDLVSEQALIDGIDRALNKGIRLMQLRAPHLQAAAYERVARRAAALCRAAGAWLLVNGTPEQALACGAAGVHLNSRRLRALSARPLPEDYWVAASCHHAQELLHACQIGVDFAVLGPVAATASHPGQTPLGWPAFRDYCRQSRVPVYAIGGMTVADIEQARDCGGQGIAAISGLWNSK